MSGRSPPSRSCCSSGRNGHAPHGLSARHPRCHATSTVKIAFGQEREWQRMSVNIPIRGESGCDDAVKPSSRIGESQDGTSARCFHRSQNDRSHLCPNCAQSDVTGENRTLPNATQEFYILLQQQRKAGFRISGRRSQNPPVLGTLGVRLPLPAPSINSTDSRDY